MKPLVGSNVILKNSHWICNNRLCLKIGLESTLPIFRNDRAFTALPFAKRHLHTTKPYQHDTTSNSQAMPLGDFYNDILSQPLPKSSTADTALPAFVKSGDLSKEERARRLFGTMERYEQKDFEKPDARWKTINGVPVPPRPEEPDNCCMSGCAHCIWDDYRDEVELWAARVREAQAKGLEGESAIATQINIPRPEVAETSTSMDDDGGGSETLWDSPISQSPDTLFQGIPVGIREFMATEKKIRERKRNRKSKFEDP